MMDCKNALVKANGDAAKAEKILKELGLAAAKKRAGRTFVSFSIRQSPGKRKSPSPLNRLSVTSPMERSTTSRRESLRTERGLWAISSDGKE